MKKITSILFLTATIFGCSSEPQAELSSGVSATLDKNQLIEHYQTFNDELKGMTENYEALEEKYGDIDNITKKAKTGDSDAKSDLMTIVNMVVSVQVTSVILETSYRAISRIQKSSDTMENEEKLDYEKFEADIEIENDKVRKMLKNLPRRF